MAVTDPIQAIKYKINENFARLFDELVNIEIVNRKSDIGFSESEKMMIKMRPGTSRVGQQLVGGTGSSKTYFYTDFFGTRRQYRGYNGKLYYLNGATWTDTGLTGFVNTDRLFFSTVKAPINFDSSIPTEYTSPAEGGGAEKIAISASDPNFGTVGAGVGYTLIVTSGVYKGAYASILSNDGTYYTLNGSGILSHNGANPPTGAESGAKYKIYRTFGDYLQVTDGLSDDRYLNGITEDTTFKGMMTASLRNIGAISSSQFAYKSTQYNSSVYTWNKSTLYYTFGTITSPFFFTIPNKDSLSVPGTIVDVFQYKSRLVILGTNFVAAKNPDGTIQKLSTTFGAKEDSFINAGSDSYFLSSHKYFYSISETITGALVMNNISKEVNNYVKNFNSNIASGFDGKRMYIYGQYDSSTTGITVVLDLQFKFWSVYTGFRAKSFVHEDGVTYVTDNNTDIVRRFDDTVFNDVGSVAIEQKLSTKEIDLNEPFFQKTLNSIYLWLDNYEQDLNVDVYMALPSRNTKKNTKNIKRSQITTSTTTSSLGGSELGTSILGGIAYNPDVSFPYMEKIQFSADSALIWKIVLTGNNGSPFYLNEMDVLMSFYGDKGSYFNPASTI